MAASTSSYKKEKEEDTDSARRISKYLKTEFPGNDLSFFKPWALDSILYRHVLDWGVPKTINALAVYVQFIWYGTTFEKHLNNRRKNDNITIVFDLISCHPSRRLQQIMNRKRSRAKTQVFLLLSVHDYNREGLNPSQISELQIASAKDRTGRDPDSRLTNLMKYVIQTDDRGDRRFRMIVRKCLAEKVGRECAPNSWRYVRGICKQRRRLATIPKEEEE